MRNALWCSLVATPLLVAAPAHAQSFETAASASIKSGTYSEAERILTRELHQHPDRPEFLLNLAAVYVYTGRATQARTLYQRVLAQKEVAMDLVSDASAGSHEIARAGLRRIGIAPETARAD
jgi:thioredoxin-like negative regulator of GroEL